MRRKKDVNKTISKVYFNPKHKAGYVGKTRLLNELKTKVKPSDLNRWLLQTDTYNLHRPARKRFPRRKYIVGGINHLIQMDLAVFSQFAKHNKGYRYVLIIIDIFSKKVYCTALKSKSGPEVSQAIEEYFISINETPTHCQTDKGTEFLNKHTQSVFKKFKVHHYTYTNQEIKASFVERVTRTLKQKIYRHFTHNNTYNYIDVLPDMVSSYNAAVHSSHGKAPNKVSYINQEEIWQDMYNPDKPVESLHIVYKFKPGDRVRISKYAQAFSKGYLPSWTEEIFSVSNRHSTVPPVYSLEDDNKNQLIGTWYEQELQKVETSNNVYKIEKIVGQRKLNGKLQYLVKWVGYDSSFNSYVNKSDMIKNYKN